MRLCTLRQGKAKDYDHAVAMCHEASEHVHMKAERKKKKGEEEQEEQEEHEDVSKKRRQNKDQKKYSGRRRRKRRRRRGRKTRLETNLNNKKNIRRGSRGMLQIWIRTRR